MPLYDQFGIIFAAVTNLELLFQLAVRYSSRYAFPPGDSAKEVTL